MSDRFLTPRVAISAIPFRSLALFTGAVLATLLASASRADHDPETWYTQEYAVLWANTPYQDVDKILNHYAKKVTTHNEDGSVDIESRESWLKEPMASWKEEGWLSATLQTVKTDSLNAGTAVFKAKWLDAYEDGSEEISCGWYLANHQGGRWQFSGYTDIDCSSHEL